jgi:NAD(P)-dependent dehydrogenase (short-subunit alcohol dehydrogenase family)
VVHRVGGGYLLKKAECKYQLDGKVCVITGASRGIGGDIALRFLGARASVVLLDINIEGANAIAKEYDPAGMRTMCLKTDVRNEQDVKDAVSQTYEKFKRIDILVNAAGILKHLPITEMSLDDFTSILDVNLTGIFLMCREVVSVMKEQEKGKIVNIASIGGETGRKGVGVNYAASKAGIVGLTKSLARELGSDNIYVNAINPGPVLTELTKQVPEEVFEVWNTGRAVNKNGLTDDVANAVLFLASDQSDWITGFALDVNGGIYM